MSDGQLSHCLYRDLLYRDLLFRQFRPLELGGGVPESTTLGRFRTRLVEQGLGERLWGEVNRQLEARRIIMTEGRINIIDATPVEAAQSGSGRGKDGMPTRDGDGGWRVKKDSRGKIKATYGYSVHTGVDEDGFIHRQSVTPGNVHDSQECERLLLGDEAALYADSAYSSRQTRHRLKRFGIGDQVQRQGYRNHPLSEKQKRRKAEIAIIRAGVEGCFATDKRCYGLARTRLLGLAKNRTFYGLAAIAHNMGKGARFPSLYGVPDRA